MFPPIALAASAYLGGSDVVDRDAAVIAERAESLGAPTRTRRDDGAEATEEERVAYAERAYTWVRDEIAHSVDAADPRVTLRAPDVLDQGVGLCFAKAHLAAALLRAGGVPTGLCYQRLRDGAGGFVVHGLIAVHLRGGWHRLDVRGNRPGLDARFDLDEERLAWAVDPDAGEVDYRDVLVEPHPDVVAVLAGAQDALALCRDGLPTALPDLHA